MTNHLGFPWVLKYNPFCPALCCYPNFRKQIKDELENSPSLKHYLLEILDECYQDAREIVSDKSQLPINTFPEPLIGTMEQVLDENWFP